MELSRAKDILKEWLVYNKEHKEEVRKADMIIELQETILKALDNSISKDEVRKKLEEQQRLFDFYAGRDHQDWVDGEFDYEVCDEIGNKIGILKELLGEE